MNATFCVHILFHKFKSAISAALPFSLEWVILHGRIPVAKHVCDKTETVQGSLSGSQSTVMVLVIQGGRQVTLSDSNLEESVCGMILWPEVEYC